MSVQGAHGHINRACRTRGPQRAGVETTRPHRESQEIDAPWHHVTERQAEVLDLLLQGLEAAEIASALVVSPNTARHHLSTFESSAGSTTGGSRALVGKAPRRVGGPCMQMTIWQRFLLPSRSPPQQCSPPSAWPGPCQLSPRASRAISGGNSQRYTLAGIDFHGIWPYRRPCFSAHWRSSYIHSLTRARAPGVGERVK